MQIGTQMNGGWQNCEMADYLCSVAIQANLFHNNMADKTVWWINQGWINEYSLYEYHECNYLLNCECVEWPVPE